MNDTIETHEEKKDRGFTLIELLIVIVILGILATVTVFAVSGITDQGQESACEADLKTLEVAVEAHNAQNGSYPADTATLVPDFLRSAPSNYQVVEGVAGGQDGSVELTATGTTNGCVAP